MSQITHKKLKQFLKLAGDKLQGDWVVLGGTVLPLLGREYRITLDIDLVPVEEQTHRSLIQLMELAETLALPVEAINPAGAYFLKKHRGWKKDLVFLHKGKSATVYRPSANLYIELKIHRLSESDLQDCLEFLKFAKETTEPVDFERLRKGLDKVQPKSELHHSRIKKLRQVLR